MSNANPTSIRLPDEMLKKIAIEADQQKRSVTKQIEWIIETYYEMQKKTQPPKA